MKDLISEMFSSGPHEVIVLLKAADFVKFSIYLSIKELFIISFKVSYKV